MNTDLSLPYIFQEGVTFETIIQLYLPYLDFFLFYLLGFIQIKILFNYIMNLSTTIKCSHWKTARSQFIPCQHVDLSRVLMPQNVLVAQQDRTSPMFIRVDTNSRVAFLALSILYWKSWPLLVLELFP